MLGWLKSLFSTIDDDFGVARSPEWPRVRAEHVERQPNCQACGMSRGIEVHHKKPVYLFPELELDPNNFLTLCGPKGNDCHRRIGHSFDTRAYNPNCVEDAARQLQRIHERRYTR